MSRAAAPLISYEVRTAVPDQEPRYLGLTAEAWARAAILGLLLAIVFRYNIERLWAKTNPFYGEPNWGHAIIVPFIGVYYLYLHREELLKMRTGRSWLGLVLMLGGLLFFAWAIWPGQNDFFKDVGMVVAIFGAVLAVCGWAVMKVAWFPIAFLLCALPWPPLIYSQLAVPLQQLAAEVSVIVLRLTGVFAQHIGTKIIIGVGEGRQALNVAEACAGLRSLMTFITVGAAIAFLSNRAMWQKLVITATAVPIAILCNVMRVAGQGLLHHYVSQELSESFAHQFVGLVMLIPAFFLILLVGWILDHIFIEQADARRVAAAMPRAALNADVLVVRRNGDAAPDPAQVAAQNLAEATRRLTVAGGAPRRKTVPPVGGRAAQVRRAEGA